MKMLWMSLLTLVMPSQICVVAFPLRTPKPTTDPPAGLSEADKQFAEDYLVHFYGYKPRSERQRRAVDSSNDVNNVFEKIKEMQKFLGLHPSGKYDMDTMAVMKKPRCGLSDVEPFEHTVRWKNKCLSYRIDDSKLPGPAFKVNDTIKAALKLWSRVALLKFCNNKREADIVVSFNSHDHQDGSPFDGEGGILAHAFLPASDIGGDVHFDADEDWSFNSTGLSLFAVAVHEFGHALGLAHSPDPGAIMYPVYNSAPKNKLRLSYHDVKDIQRLYGPSPKYLLRKKPPPKTPHKCDKDLSFDAITELQEEIIFFKGRFMWRKHPQFTQTSITLINSLWPDTIPSDLNAVYENVEENFLVFFKGYQYWKVVQSKVKEGFPKNISEFGFPSRIKSVDAALHFRLERYTVFFTGHECWRYNEERNMMEGSPMHIDQEWPGIPHPIDAAIYHDGLVHFFKGNLHFRYNFDRKRIISTTSTGDFLDCHKETNNEIYGKKR